MSAYWGTGTPASSGTYGKVKNSLNTTYNPNGVMYINKTSTPTVITTAYPNAASATYPNAAGTSYGTSYVPVSNAAVATGIFPASSASAGKISYYSQDWTPPGSKNTYKGGNAKRGGYWDKRMGQMSSSPQAIHYCEICKLTCGTSATYKAHLDGAPHKKKAARASEAAAESKSAESGDIWKCLLCDVNSSSAFSFKAHMNGSKHGKKVDLHKRLGKVVPDPVIPEKAEETEAAKEREEPIVGAEFIETKEDPALKRSIFYCGLCKCSFTDSNAKDMHLVGRRHRLEYKKKHDSSLKVDYPASKRQKIIKRNREKRGGFMGGRGFGRGGGPPMGYRGDPYNRGMLEEESSTYKQVWEAEQRQLEEEWNQYREEDRWYRYIEGVQRQEEQQRRWYIQERNRCEQLGIAPPPPPPRPRPPPPPPTRDNSRRMLANQDEKLIHQKHLQIFPTEEEFAELEKIVGGTEGFLDELSDVLDEEYKNTDDYKKTAALKDDKSSKPTPAAAPAKEDSAKEVAAKEGIDEAKAEENSESAAVPEPEEDKHHVIKTTVRVGDHVKNIVLHGHMNSEILVFCVKKPTVSLLTKAYSFIKDKFTGASESMGEVVVATNTFDGFISLKKTEPVPLEVVIRLTAASMRDEEISEKIISSDKHAKVLNRTACLNALATLRHTKWFESRATINSLVVLRILKDLNKRIPAWSPLSSWSLELMVERSQRTPGFSNAKAPPAELLRRVFELLASGFLLVNSPGLNDPCEKDPVDVLSYLSTQEREDLSASAQYALRLMAFNQLYKILGIPEPPPPQPMYAPRGMMRGKRPAPRPEQDPAEAPPVKMET